MSLPSVFTSVVNGNDKVDREKAKAKIRLSFLTTRISWQGLRSRSRIIQLPMLLSLQLENKGFDIIIMWSESLSSRWS